MPAPIEIVTAYEQAKRDRRKAAVMAVMNELEIQNTIQFWAFASDSAKNIAKSFFTMPQTA